MPRQRASHATLRALAALGLGLLVPACSLRWDPPGKPKAEQQPADATLSSFDSLFSSQCAGCHGAGGRGGLAIGLAAPSYLAIAPDDAIKRAIAQGRPHTAMPAFAESAGGLLTSGQVAALVAGIRAWSSAAPATDLPTYSATSEGNAERGGLVFAKRCASCHGIDGQGDKAMGSIVADSLLELVSEQALRTHVLAGRPDLGCPDFRSNGAAAMSNDEVSDTVAWLESHRSHIPGQAYRGAHAEGTHP